ncbi:hypothetical protein [Leifsonia sp. 22587]|uniref:hypothetical protein n=1 Tax=Leifsonia sp. 22587 TaxID=3453946 RepID=UPI003F83AB58
MSEPQAMSRAGENMQRGSDDGQEMRRVVSVGGPSAYACAIVGRALLVVWLLLLGAMLAVVLARPHDPTSPYFATFFGVLGTWVASCVIIGVMVVVTRIQMRRERNLGYTWARDDFVNLSQIDPASGVVIREPGEPLLSEDERRRRVAAARSWAANNPVTK